MNFVLGWRKLFVLLPVLLAAVGVFGDPCNVTHQGKETTYIISNPKSNAEWEYSWADSNGKVLATDQMPKGNESISSSYRSLTVPVCQEKVCVKLDCEEKHYTICCNTDCPAAPEPQANPPAAAEHRERIDPTNSSSPALAVSWTPGGKAGIAVGIAAVIVAVIAAVRYRKKMRSWLERFKRPCSSNEPQSGSGAAGRPEDIPMLDV